jgi:signal transduction histidine kinase
MSQYMASANEHLFILLVGIMIMTMVVYLSGVIIGFFLHRPKWKSIADVVFLVAHIANIFGYLMINGNIDIPLTWVFLYAPVVEVAVSVFIFIMTRKWVYLLDIAGFLGLMPFLQLSPFSIVFYFIADLYVFGRSAMFLATSYNQLSTSLNRYTIKASLDGLDGGLLVADKRGNITYVNQYFLDFLKAEAISPYQKTEMLQEELIKRAKRLDETSFLFKEGERYLLLKQHLTSLGREVTLSDVTEEEKLTESLAKANEELTKQQEVIKDALDSLKEVERQKEQDRMLVAVHDSFAQEVSFIHQILTNPEINDLTSLKKLVKRGFSNIEIRVDTLEGLVSDYQVMGIFFKVDGDLDNLPYQETALAVVSEAIDNAIRHGNATQISISILRSYKDYTVVVTNDGQVPKGFTPHNGLANLKKLVESCSGQFDVTVFPAFTVSAVFPI